MIILLNGPAGSGKDTIANLMMGQRHVDSTMAFKAPMFTVALAASGISATDWFARYDDRKLKELPWDRLNGMSCREFMIHISESFIKPVFGDGYFGNHLGHRYNTRARDVRDIAVSDSGFQGELTALNATVGAGEVLIVRLRREGYTFEGDSRSYINAESGNHLIDVNLVDGYPSQAVGTIVSVMAAIRKGSDVALVKG